MSATTYKISSYDALTLFRIGRPNLCGLLCWLERKLGPTETILIEHWTDSLFYVSVMDSRIQRSPDNLGIGFTVDLANDRIFWNASGGNCWVRSAKWKRMVGKTRVDGLTEAQDFHVYKVVPIPKAQIKGKSSVTSVAGV
jgi:hypothetical protein